MEMETNTKKHFHFRISGFLWSRLCLRLADAAHQGRREHYDVLIFFSSEA